MIRYVVVKYDKSDMEGFMKHVCDMSEDGWELAGGIGVDEKCVYQAMWRKVK